MALQHSWDDEKSARTTSWLNSVLQPEKIVQVKTSVSVDSV